MSVPTLEVLNPGLFTTVQDRGRYGFQRLGVPVSGAMDEFALRAANILVGNEDGAACLEMTVVGPTLRFLAPTRIAVTGGDLTPTIDGAPLSRWQTLGVADGAELTFGDMQDGMRAYLAVAGGIDVPTVMNSRSTYVPGGFGGVDGRTLQKDDVLSSFESNGVASRSVDNIPVYGEEHEVRVVVGIQASAFGAEAIEEFLSTTFTISLDSDRMGYKLDGLTVSHAGSPDIISDGNPPGAIQVSGDGVPTILLADRGTTGGYTEIATVIGVDLPTLAQALPGQSVTFAQVSIDEAHDALRRQEAALDAIRKSDEAPAVMVLIDGESIESEDEDGNPLSVAELSATSATTVTETLTAAVDGHEFEFDVEVQRGE